MSILINITVPPKVVSRAYSLEVYDADAAEELAAELVSAANDLRAAQAAVEARQES